MKMAEYGDDLYDSDPDETLSFCDFSNDDNYNNNYYSSPSKYPNSPDMFEFLIDPDLKLDSASTIEYPIIFCGKEVCSSHLNREPQQKPKVFTRDPQNGLFLLKTNSFKRSKSLRSFDLADKPSFKSSPATASCRFQSTTTSTKSRTSSRKHKFVLIGSLSKPHRKMVLSDMKKRQEKLARPAPLLFPVNEEEAGEASVAMSSGTHKSRLLPPLRCRAHFVSALISMKVSFGCIPSPGRPVNDGHATLT